jgi:hypothetical protein
MYVSRSSSLCSISLSLLTSSLSCQSVFLSTLYANPRSPYFSPSVWKTKFHIHIMKQHAKLYFSIFWFDILR